MTRLAALLLLGVAAIAGAATVDRGWSEGTPAAQTPMIVAGHPAEDLPLPKDLVARLKGPTVLFYFSPTCPHCRAVAPEVNALAERIRDHAPILGVASGNATDEELLEFRGTFGVTWPIVHDRSREIGSALGVRSTPSALLVVPDGKGKVDVKDAWYPYMAGFAPLVEGRARGDVFSVFRKGEYQGSRFCGTCHTIEYGSYALTHHSVAWRTLEAQGKTDDPACTGCHVTGAGQPGGWDGDPHSALVDVGCEACHGPGGPHDGERTDAAATCAGCHDDKHSIAFTVDKGLPLIDHYLAAHLPDEAFKARRLALLKGEAPRELLAFEGANVGAAACLSCHPDQSAHWAASPHASAMKVLVDQGKHEDPSCVRCHATARTAGAPPTDLSAYRVDEGVSCESCHGPGEAHVAAGGGTDNIERLGDDCPVCVIDSVCTSCHVPAWDPDWDLEADLPKVHHR